MIIRDPPWRDFLQLPVLAIRPEVKVKSLQWATQRKKEGGRGMTGIFERDPMATNNSETRNKHANQEL